MMYRNKIILTIFLIVLVGGVIFFLNHNPALELPLTKTQPVQPSPSGIVYDANGKLDTSNWQEYRSEYGGFSVRAPKVYGVMAGCGHACDPAVSGQYFYYVFFQTSINEEAGAVGLSINIIKKNAGSTLDNWLDNYIVSGRDQLLNVQKTSINGYPALQFDWQKTSNQEPVYMLSGVYPNGDVRDSIFIDPTAASSKDASSRFVIIDLGDRYAFASHSLSIDKEALAKSYTSWGYPAYAKQALMIPDNKTLADIYAAILDSFQAFPPTKP
jgi:hypothetical protein